MTPKGETRIALVFTAIILALIALTFVGCKTPKTVTETLTEYVHDTVTVHKADTVEITKVEKDSVIEYKLLAIHDTTIIDRGSCVVLKENGDTLRQWEWNNVLQKVHEKENNTKNETHIDSASYYKATVDSLRAALHEAKSKEKVVVKTKYILRWWEWGIIGLLAVALVAAVIKRSIKKF